MAEIAIYIQAQPLTKKEYQGQRVVTFKDIDTPRQRPEGTARRNFNTNKRHFIEGEDFYTVELSADEIRTQFGAGKNAGRSMTVLIKMGYLMLVKSFTDGLAWMVQRQLVKSYFESHPEPEPVRAALPQGERPLPKIGIITGTIKEGNTMSINEIESKVRELRQPQALIEEGQAMERPSRFASEGFSKGDPHSERDTCRQRLYPDCGKPTAEYPRDYVRYAI